MAEQEMQNCLVTPDGTTIKPKKQIAEELVAQLGPDGEYTDFLALLKKEYGEHALIGQGLFAKARRPIRLAAGWQLVNNNWLSPGESPPRPFRPNARNSYHIPAEPVQSEEPEQPAAPTTPTSTARQLTPAEFIKAIGLCKELMALMGSKDNVVSLVTALL